MKRFVLLLVVGGLSCVLVGLMTSCQPSMHLDPRAPHSLHAWANDGNTSASLIVDGRSAFWREDDITVFVQTFDGTTTSIASVTVRGDAKESAGLFKAAFGFIAGYFVKGQGIVP